MERHISKITEDRTKLREKEKEASKVGGARLTQQDIFESVKLIEKEVVGGLSKEVCLLETQGKLSNSYT